MPRNGILLIAALGFGFAFSGDVAAQETSLAGEPAKKKFEAKVEELRAQYQTEIKAANTEYIEKLNELIKAATANGDLDKVLAFKTEKEWIEGGKPPAETPAAQKILLTFRTAFELKKKTANANFEKSAKLAQAEYLADLDSVIKDETKEGRIESALKVRDQRKEAEKASLPSVAKPPVVSMVPEKEPNPGPVSPTPASDARKIWVCKDSKFTKQKDGSWIELKKDGRKIEFIEASRTDTFVELSQKHGDCFIRLLGKTSDIKRGKAEYKTWLPGGWKD
jgi:hypothetical protein